MLTPGHAIHASALRQITATAEAERDAQDTWPSAPHPLAGVIYTAPPAPKSCSTCSRRGTAMREVATGHVECSHIECPHRKTFTARPSASGVRLED